MLQAVWSALGGDPALVAAVSLPGEGDLPAAFAVSDLAQGAVAAVGLAAAEHAGLPPGAVSADRRLASLWFGWTFRPLGWEAPAPWDPLAGDYRAADGWLRLHTNAPHHRAAALRVLGLAPEAGPGGASGAAPGREAVDAAVRAWPAEALEAAVVAAGGCAAAMRTPDAWAAHPQGRAVAAEPLVAWEHVPSGAAAPAAGSGPPGLAGAAPHRAPDPGRPLAGVRVLDLTRVLAGPVCTRALAGLGAEVLRLDPPGWDEPGVVPDVTPGKRCARLDARTAEGRATLHALLRGADVLVHGYRPGALEGLGLGPAGRAALRPGLVDVSLDAYGHTGPWAGRRGFDSLVQMSAGIAAEGMRRFGTDRPKPLPVQALDHATGWIMAAAVLRGLTERRRTGEGWRARASLARTAALLATTVGGGDAHGTLGTPAEADFAATPERTQWGLMARLHPPLRLGADTLRWERGASALGSAVAGWEG